MSQLSRFKPTGRGSLALSCVLAAALLPACKSTNSSGAKAAPTAEEVSTMDISQWLVACETELQNPQSGAASRSYLVKLAQTDDCNAAYPIVKELADKYVAARKN